MKVFLGSKVSSNEFGSGVIVAMTPHWCIYKAGGVEIALPWEDIFVEVDPPEDIHTAERCHDLTDTEERGEAKK